jgi:hypothetical protein
MKTTNQILGAAMALLFGFGVLATEAAVNENFDTIFSTSYANQTGNGWRINSGLRSSSSRSGSCARLASAGSANYLQYEGADGNGKDGGVGTISFWYRGWDNNPQEKFKVQVDINGAGFTDISSEISPTLTYTEFTYDLNNASDNIIVRIQQTAGERILIDDASIGDYSGGSTPTITLSSGDLSAFSTTYGIASAAQSFTVAGSDLTANITVTAPSGYNVSLSHQHRCRRKDQGGLGHRGPGRADRRCGQRNQCHGLHRILVGRLRRQRLPPRCQRIRGVLHHRRHS